MKYIYFNLDFSFIMCSFNQRFFSKGYKPKSCWKSGLHPFSCTHVHPAEHRNKVQGSQRTFCSGFVCGFVGAVCLDLWELPMQRLSQSSVLCARSWQVPCVVLFILSLPTSDDLKLCYLLRISLLSYLFIRNSLFGRWAGRLQGNKRNYEL